MSVGWEGRRVGSVVARHEWKGLSKLSHSLEDWVDKQKAESQARLETRRRSQVFQSDSDTDED